jgi:hypothetical protein
VTELDRRKLVGISGIAAVPLPSTQLPLTGKPFRCRPLPKSENKID